MGNRPSSKEIGKVDGVFARAAMFASHRPALSKRKHVGCDTSHHFHIPT